MRHKIFENFEIYSKFTTLLPYDSMIHNMVSERYLREDNDDASTSDSTYDEDEVCGGDEVLRFSPTLDNSALHNQIIFGSFDLVSSASIKPQFDGFSIKIGEISRVLSNSCSNIINNDDSSIVDLQEKEYMMFLEPKLKNRYSYFFCF